MPGLKPVVTPIDEVVMLNQSIAVSSFFTVTDPDGDEIVQYRITDENAAGSSGFFIFQGQVQQNGAQLLIDADDLDELFYVGGPVVGNQFIRIQASDGNLFSDPVVAKAYTARPEQVNPIAVVNDTSVLGNESVLASSFISAFDPDGFPIVGYSIRDVDDDRSFFSLDGAALEQGVFHNLSAAEFDRLVYNAVGRRDEDIEVRSFDGTNSSAIARGNVNTRANLNRPVVNFASANTIQDELLPLAPLIVASDADGSTIKTFELRDRNNKDFSGSLFFQGERLEPRVFHSFTPDQLDQVFFVGGTRNIDEQVRVFATDGRFRSQRETILLTNVATGTSGGSEAGIPVVRGDNLNENIREQLDIVNFSTLFEQVDGGLSAVSFEVIDTDPFPTSSTIFLDGQAQESGEILTFTDAEFERLQLRTGTFEARNIEELFVRADNGSFKSDWTRVNVHTEPEFFEAFSELDLNGFEVATWADFIVADGLGPTQITFSFAQQFPNYNTGEAAENPLRMPTPRLFLPFTDPQREWTRYLLNHIETFANVEFVEVVDSPLTVDPVSGNRGGTLRFANYYRALAPNLGGANPSDDSQTCTQTFGPGTAPEAGDVWINIDASIAPFFITNNDGVPAISGCSGLDFFNPLDLGPGTFEYWTLLDTVNFAIGQGLPFDLIGGGDQNPILPDDTSIDVFTVQGAQTDFAPVTGYGLYDINYFQEVYGANNTYNLGDTTYSAALNLNNGADSRETIWDAGGIDTISAVGSTIANPVVDLRPGFQSSIGNFQNNIFVAFGAEIENATGSIRNDTLLGNELDNVLSGGQGNDTLRGYGGDDFLTGGTGGDTFVFTVADGDNTIDEQRLAGRDTVQFLEFPQLDSFSEDFQFRLEGRDLVISLTLDGSATADTTVRIIDQTRGASRIESLSFGSALVDLDNLTSQATGANQQFQLTAETTIFGNLVAPV